jgi:hypothetical protein
MSHCREFSPISHIWLAYLARACALPQIIFKRGDSWVQLRLATKARAADGFEKRDMILKARNSFPYSSASLLLIYTK